ncbi:hypothetical protein [Synechococcus sp. PCC 6312]|uniref:hypothetical protein n=1 Tax=Synechococcus sp. (strain ATCC 27167 / PCC 6312) TaxID=195253 RepID=UPI00029EE667|nr:hypothetical protein [Synechococcus sp. PCC 6312]AFY60351.1 hypothetical protein Syn6312_1166 [Synechococcus sp. PCC 6312]
MIFYDPENPERGAVAVPQGDFQTPIAEEDFETLVAGLEPETAPPNWDGFNGAILSDVRLNQVQGAALSVAPAAAIALPAALSQVSTNGVTAFGLVFGAVCGAGGATTEDRQAWADLAESCNLPAEFVAVVRGE